MLTDQLPGDLFQPMPIIWLQVTADPTPQTNIYQCPVYKTSLRSGELLSTGHYTNYVMTIQLPSQDPEAFWVKRGVALLC
jgi:dynein heavy chain